jgi:multicomponent Na+:H+ antiporter subunit A
MIFALLALHGALAVAVVPLGLRLGRKAILLGAVAPAAAAVWGAYVARRMLGGEVWTENLRLAPSLGFELTLRVDPFGLLMFFIVSGIGILVFLYAFSYFAESRTDLGKFTSALLAFAGSMLGLVISDNLLGLFFFWEATSIASYLLIGFNDRSEQARAAALQALLTTGLGGLVMLAGIVIVGQASQTFSISEIVHASPSGRLVDVGLVCILIGAFTKSAQAPFHSWLPSAMAAPTPISAYLHSATMVKAGVFLIARLSPAFGPAATWRILCAVVGLSSMWIGAYRALRQFDLKLLLAYGTISQLGFMVALFGLGDAKAAFAAVVVLVAHALYKAAAFMSAGIVDRCAGTRDIRELHAVGRAMPALVGITGVAAASMAGLPPLLGFIAKESALSALTNPTLPLWGPAKPLAVAVATAASGLTLAYAVRFMRGAFGSRTKAELRLWNVQLPERTTASRPNLLFQSPVAALAALSLAGGLYAPLLGWIVEPAAAALYPSAYPSAYHGQLALWHGFGWPVALTLIALAAGFGLTAARLHVERLQQMVPKIPGSMEGYRAALKIMLEGASRTTGIVQCGSLPVYLTVIGLTLVALPGIPLGLALLRWSSYKTPYYPVPPLAYLTAALVILLAMGIATARSRFAAVLMLGGVGYGVGIFFVIQGAPDLALTQFCIETLLLIVFALVLRHLPRDFSRARFRPYTALRLAMAVLVGAFVFLFATLASGARQVSPVSDAYIAMASTEAHARNVVNAILVDFRAFDTMGEITVLAVAAVGIAALVASSRAALRAGSGDSEERGR